MRGKSKRQYVLDTNRVAGCGSRANGVLMVIRGSPVRNFRGGSQQETLGD